MLHLCAGPRPKNLGCSIDGQKDKKQNSKNVSQNSDKESDKERDRIGYFQDSGSKSSECLER